MTRAIRILCSLLLALAIAAPAVAQPGSLKLPPYKKVILRNGMTLLLMEQHEVPLVSFSVIVKAGSVSDPAGKEGVASMTAALLRKGTATRSADDFSAQLDFIGGWFGAGAGSDGTYISAEFMKKDLAKGQAQGLVRQKDARRGNLAQGGRVEVWRCRATSSMKRLPSWSVMA